MINSGNHSYFPDIHLQREKLSQYIGKIWDSKKHNGKYVYESCDVHEDYGNPYALVTYNVYLRGTESVGTVTMRLNPADNENNFVITSKVTDLVM